MVAVGGSEVLGDGRPVVCRAGCLADVQPGGAVALLAAGRVKTRRSDAGVLALLLQRPLAIGQLGEALRISRQAARQMADGLVERGYATFGTDDADARRTLVVLTPRGKAYGRAIWMAQDALNETVRSRVSEADLAAADAVLWAVFPDDARQRADKRMSPPS